MAREGTRPGAGGATQAIEQASQSGWASPQHPNSSRNAYLLARLTAFSPEKPVHAEQLGLGEAGIGRPGDTLALARRGARSCAVRRMGRRCGRFVKVGSWMPNGARNSTRRDRALVMLKRSDDGESRQVATRVLGRHVMRSPASRRVWHLHDWIGLRIAATGTRNAGGGMIRGKVV